MSRLAVTYKESDRITTNETAMLSAAGELVC